MGRQKTSNQSTSMTSEFQQLALEDMSWFYPKRLYDHRPKKDVSITIQRAGNGRRTCVNFTVRNGFPKMIGGSSEKVICAPVDGKIYFKECARGFKLFGRNSKTIRYFKVSTANAIDELRDYVGDYDMKYDSLLGLYFIQKTA